MVTNYFMSDSDALGDIQEPKTHTTAPHGKGARSKPFLGQKFMVFDMFFTVSQDVSRRWGF